MDYRKAFIFSTLFVVSLLFLAGGYYAQERQEPGLLVHFLDELGIAGLVAGVLALTIERISQEEFKRLALKERNLVKRDVFHYVYGHPIPRELVAEIQNQLLQGRFERRNFVLSHTIQPYLADPRFVRVSTMITYELHNLSPDRQPYHFRTVFEDAPEPSVAAECKFLALRVSGADRLIDYKGDGLLRAQGRGEIAGHITLDEDIELEGEGSAQFTIHTQTVKYRDYGYDFFLCTLPTQGFDMKVSLHNVDLEMSAHAFHPEGLSTGQEHQPSLNRYHWRLKRPVLIYQGACLLWKAPRPGAARRPVPDAGARPGPTEPTGPADETDAGSVRT